jgi:hypothetical protein
VVGWNRCSFVTTDDNIGASEISALRQAAAVANITIVTTVTLPLNQSDYSPQLAALKHAQTPVILSVIQDSDTALSFYPQAASEGVMANGTAWLMSSFTWVVINAGHLGTWHFKG